MCGWIPYVTTMSALLSSMILTCIAVDRYQGVILLSGKWDPKFSTAALIVGCLWLIAAGIFPIYAHNILFYSFASFSEKVLSPSRSALFFKIIRLKMRKRFNLKYFRHDRTNVPRLQSNACMFHKR